MSRRMLSGKGFSHGSAVWTPLSLGANLMGWYKADAGVTGSPSVTAWADQGPTGANLANNGGASPQFNATGLGGKEAIVFTAASAQMLQSNTGTPVVPWGGTSAYAIWALASYTANSVFGGSEGFRATGSGPSFTSADLSFDGSIPRIQASSGFTIDSSFGTPVNQSHRYGLNAVGGTPVTTLYVDGAAVGTPATVTRTLTGNGFITLNKAGTNGFDGPLREIIFVNRGLTGPEITQIDTYLASRQ